jgi:hypothetical protein
VNNEIEKQLPIFRALTVGGDDYPAGLEVKGDFIYTPPWTNKNGLAFSAAYEIWLRPPTTESFNFFIDPKTLEISLDGGNTFTKVLKDQL